MTFNPISTECELSVMYRILLGHWETFRIKKKKTVSGLVQPCTIPAGCIKFSRKYSISKGCNLSICCNLSKCLPGRNIAVDTRSLRQSTGSFQNPAGSVTRQRMLWCGREPATAFSYCVADGRVRYRGSLAFPGLQRTCAILRLIHTPGLATIYVNRH